MLFFVIASYKILDPPTKIIKTVFNSIKHSNLYTIRLNEDTAAEDRRIYSIILILKVLCNETIFHSSFPGTENFYWDHDRETFRNNNHQVNETVHVWGNQIFHL